VSLPLFKKKSNKIK